MKLLLLFLCVCQALVFGQEIEGEMEVRSYRVDLIVFWTVHGEFFTAVGEPSDPYGAEPKWRNDAGADWLGAKVKDAPFESRFLKVGTVMRDCTSRVGELLGRKKFAGQAVYDLGEKRMVVKAGREVHWEIREVLENRGTRMIRTEVSVYLVPEVTKGKRELVMKGPPEEGEMVASLSCVHLPGQAYEARTGDGKFVIEGDSQIDGTYDYVDHRMTVHSDFPEASFTLKTGFAWLSGLEMVHEVGSLDGEKSVLVVTKSDLVMMDGSLVDEWILKENGGAFLLEERLALVRGEKPEKEEEEGEMKRFDVPPTFLSFIGPTFLNGDDDPFAVDVERGKRAGGAPLYAGKAPELARFSGAALFDAKDLLMKNGLTFREGDFAVFNRSMNALFVKLSEMQLELLKGIIIPQGPNPPRLIRVDLVELDGGADEGGAQILRKIGMVVYPGQNGTVTLGPDLALEVEAQIDGNNEMVDIRLTLAEQGGDLERASFKTGVFLMNGEAALIQGNRVGEREKTWMVRGSVVVIGE